MADPAQPPAGGQPPAAGAPPAQPAAGQPPAQPPPAAGAPPAQPPAGAPPAPGQPPTEPYASFPTAEAFQERVKREARAQMRDLLGAEPDTVKAGLARLTELEEAEKKRQESDLSDLEKARKEAEEAKAEQTTAEADRDRFQLQAHISGICAKRGIREVGYAEYRIMQKLGELPEDQQLDEEAYLDELLKDGQARIALGVDVAPAQPPAAGQPPQTQTQPATSTPATGGQYQQPAPPPAAGQQPQKTAFDYTPEEWQARKRSLGIT